MPAGTTNGPVIAPETDGSRRSPPRPTRLAALLVALIAAVSAVLPVPVVVPCLLLGALGGCLVVDLVASRHNVVTLERTRTSTLSLLVPVTFRARVSGLDRARRGPNPPARAADARS